MEQTIESFDDIATRKDLSYLCILVVLILHILFLLLLFTFTHLMKQEPMSPSFDTMFDVSAPPPGSATSTPSGTGSNAPDDADDGTQETTEPSAQMQQSGSDDQEMIAQEDTTDTSEEPMPAISPEDTALPDLVDNVIRSERPIPPSPISGKTSIAKKTSHTTHGGYRVRKMHYDTNFSINGTSFAQMGQQVHNTITQTRIAEAKEKRTKNLKYQSYVNSLHHFLYGNFNPRNESINLEYSVYMPIDVDIEIDKKGLCKAISLSNSTGDHDLDSFIIYHLKKAGPFPPLPNHFGVDSWHFQLRLMVNCQRGKGIPKITPH